MNDANLKAVLEATELLGYRPNALARSLRRQVTDMIGLVVPQVSNPFFSALIEHIDWELQSGHYQLLVCDAHEDTDIEADRLRALLERQVDGIMIVPCDDNASMPAVRFTAARIPVVQVDRRVSGEVTDWVGVDDAAGMQLVVEHVAATGAKSAAFVSCALTNSSARRRFDAFVSAADAIGLRWREPIFHDFSVECGIRASRTLLQKGRLPDAVICGNDLVAIGVVRQFLLAGRAVPGEVVVTGFDDSPSAELVTPQLTTVRQPLEAIAKAALRLLVDRRQDADGPHEGLALSPELVARESTSRDHPASVRETFSRSGRPARKPRP